MQKRRERRNGITYSPSVSFSCFAFLLERSAAPIPVKAPMISMPYNPIAEVSPVFTPPLSAAADSLALIEALMEALVLSDSLMEIEVLVDSLSLTDADSDSLALVDSLSLTDADSDSLALVDSLSLTDADSDSLTLTDSLSLIEADSDSLALVDSLSLTDADSDSPTQTRTRWRLPIRSR